MKTKFVPLILLTLSSVSYESTKAEERTSSTESISLSPKERDLRDNRWWPRVWAILKDMPDVKERLETSYKKEFDKLWMEENPRNLDQDKINWYAEKVLEDYKRHSIRRSRSGSLRAPAGLEEALAGNQKKSRPSPPVRKHPPKADAEQGDTMENKRATLEAARLFRPTPKPRQRSPEDLPPPPPLVEENYGQESGVIPPPPPLPEVGGFLPPPPPPPLPMPGARVSTRSSQPVVKKEEAREKPRKTKPSEGKGPMISLEDLRNVRLNRTSRPAPSQQETEDNKPSWLKEREGKLASPKKTPPPVKPRPKPRIVNDTQEDAS